MLQPTLNEIILEQANKCVLCGLCLPACPTFNESRREAQSPRGRTSFAKALAENTLPASKQLLSSLAGCLLCRACEQACPSDVGFRKMMLATRALIKQSAQSKSDQLRPIVRFIIYLASKPKTYSLLVTIYTKSGLRWCLQKTRVLKLLRINHIDALLPTSQSAATPAKQLIPLQKPVQRIGFFAGCLGQSLDAQTSHSVHQIFNALNIELVSADRPLCCGGLSKSDINEFLAAFPADIKTIVSCVSGCTAELCETLAQHKDNDKNLLDVSVYLSQQNFQGLRFKPYDGLIAVHEPCSLRYPLAAEKFVYNLLKLIPGARMIPMPENDKCCGGAGDYMFRQPVMAKKLRDNKLRAMAILQPAVPHIIVTSNLGCATNLQAGLQDQNKRLQNKQTGHKHIEVVHPVTLLARQVRATQDNSKQGGGM